MRHLTNVSFRRENVFAEPIAGRWDAIVCSEVLYYAGGRKQLGRVAASIADALMPGGVLVTAHANLVVDAARAPGFDWDEAFGARGIQKGLRASGTLKLSGVEIATPMYRVQRWRRRPVREGALRRRLPARAQRQRGASLRRRPLRGAGPLSAPRRPPRSTPGAVRAAPADPHVPPGRPHRHGRGASLARHS